MICLSLDGSVCNRLQPCGGMQERDWKHSEV